MTTTLEEREEKGIHRRVASRNDSGIWGRGCATFGAVVWAGLAVAARVGVARIGAIELMFLFAPLVIVPLGMELERLLTSPPFDTLRAGLPAQTARAKWSSHLRLFARRAQPFAAAFAVIAMLLPPGLAAGLLACSWLGICLFAGGTAVIDSATFWSDAGGGARATLTLATVIARFDLVVGGSWLVASRLGMRPLGIQEPIGLLTAVHFHFAGFATAIIAAAMLRFAEGRAQERLLKWLVPFVVGMPYVVATGFVISPALKMVAATGFSISVAALAIILQGCGRRAEQRTARILLQIAATAVFAGMVLSSAYAIADFRGSDVLPIPQMARTHGVLNAVGFCMTGLLGWIVEFEVSADPVRPSPV